MPLWDAVASELVPSAHVWTYPVCSVEKLLVAPLDLERPGVEVIVGAVRPLAELEHQRGGVRTPGVPRVQVAWPRSVVVGGQVAERKCRPSLVHRRHESGLAGMDRVDPLAGVLANRGVGLLLRHGRHEVPEIRVGGVRLASADLVVSVGEGPVRRVDGRRRGRVDRGERGLLVPVGLAEDIVSHEGCGLEGHHRVLEHIEPVL